MRVEKVFITPLEDIDTYGAEVDVSGHVRIDGLSKIKRSIDSTDFTIGVYRFDDLKLKCDNSRGTFNEQDSRSIFPFTRDKAKVRVEVLKITKNAPGDYTTETKIQFKGLINDESTRQDITKDLISMTALSNDSVLRTTQVQAGVITTGNTAKQALTYILSQTSITKVLTVDPLNINPEYDFIIDNPRTLDNLQVKKAFDLILAASSSVLLIENDEIIVQGREKTTSPILELKGPGELTGNCNVIGLSGYNTGKQRQFNSIRLNDGTVTVKDKDSIAEYELRQKEFEFPMIEDEDTLEAVGRSIVEEFRYPKIELTAVVQTELIEDFALLDWCRLDAPFIAKPQGEDFLPVCGVAVCGDAQTPLPSAIGSVQILSNIKFKIISFADNPTNFTTIIKLRQSGKTTNDGVF